MVRDKVQAADEGDHYSLPAIATICWRDSRQVTLLFFALLFCVAKVAGREYIIVIATIVSLYLFVRQSAMLLKRRGLDQIKGVPKTFTLSQCG